MNGWTRIDLPPAVKALAPGTRGYQRDVKDGGHLSVLVGREPTARRICWHLSISHRTRDLKPGRYPTWDEIGEARYRFIPDDVTVAMLLPPKAEYVNVHATTFHLWEIDGDT